MTRLRNETIVIKEHKLTYSEIQEMVPFEFDLNVAVSVEYFEKKKKK